MALETGLEVAVMALGVAPQALGSIVLRYGSAGSASARTLIRSVKHPISAP